MSYKFSKLNVEPRAENFLCAFLALEEKNLL
jgi:hypothetical protein